MAINKNHEFEDLDNIKCAIVEKNASADRVQFLKNLLEFNQYQVVVVGSPAPKAAPVAAAPIVDGVEATPAPIAEPAAPTSFTVGVTNLTFNATNAILGRSLKTKEGSVVSLAYWQQKEALSNDELPYFENVH